MSGKGGGPATVIPAYAGIPRLPVDNTIIRQYRRDSRLRGNDGRRSGRDSEKAAIPRPSKEWRPMGFLKGQPPVKPPYFRVRRMVFLQVALQFRLCRAFQSWG